MTATYADIRIDHLVIHPKNVRRDVGIVTDLANSITAQGILQPLVVAPEPKPAGWETPSIAGKYIVIAGHRRLAAAKLANLEILPCVIRQDLDTDPKQIEAMLVENTQRTDLTVIEEAQAYQTLLDFPDYNIKKVAKKTGRSEATIRKRLLLNKLDDKAKSRLEDHTLNIDQALVLVDFADNEEATKSLLAAASSPRDWNFQVQTEIRKRDAPLKVAALEDELAEAVASLLPEDGRYNYTKWTRIYENDENALTVDAHVAAGHHAYIDRAWGRLEWYEKVASQKTPKPELTEEEKQAKRREAELSAALQIAHAVRAEHLKAVIKEPPAGAAHDALLKLAKQAAQPVHRLATIAEVLGCAQELTEIDAALDKASTDTLAMLLPFLQESREDDLLKLWAWDARDYRHTWGPKTWLETLQTIYGYELSAVEQEVLDHFQALADNNINQEEEDTDDDYNDDDY